MPQLRGHVSRVNKHGVRARDSHDSGQSTTSSGQRYNRFLMIITYDWRKKSEKGKPTAVITLQKFFLLPDYMDRKK